MSNPLTVTSPLLPDLEEFSTMLQNIWNNKWITNNGQYHQQLEEALCKYLKVPFISLFTNGTLPLLTALQALRVSGEVITTPYTFVATTHSIWWNGLRPVFVDIDPSNCTPEQLAEYQKAQGELGQALGRLIAISESYPDLKANENFINLQEQLEGTENRINEARNKFNSAVTEYNRQIRSFPNNLLAGIFGFQTMEKFAADEGAQNAPKVQF